MTDIVERLTGYAEHPSDNKAPFPDRLACDAAAEIARLRAELAEYQERDNGHREIIREMTERNAHYRAALRIIAGEEQCRDNLLGNSDIARIALHGK